jgi:hypothetical protein
MNILEDNLNISIYIFIINAGNCVKAGSDAINKLKGRGALLL